MNQCLQMKCILLLLFLALVNDSNAQITERSRPKEWDQLVPGGRFMDRFQSMPSGKLSSQPWGGDNVKPRMVDNGIEDNENSYWGGNILYNEVDGLYHMYVCGWPEKSPSGHQTWPHSVVYHAVCTNPIGPFVIKETVGPGHNPEAFRLDDGRVVVYVIDNYYISDSYNGPWKKKQFEFDPCGHKIIDGLSNLSFARRTDGSRLMVCRGGGIWVSKNGLSTYYQLTDQSVYPPIEGRFEDPVIWRDSIQYHLIVNDWYGRIAYYLRSKDGIKWIVDPGEAYSPGISRHADGTEENWFKYERMKVLQDSYGRAIQANFAVIDTFKGEDKGNDNHSSKNISIPLNPGVLLTMLHKAPIDGYTQHLKLLIKAEPGFNPHTDIELTTLRFGASAEVNYGRGAKLIKTQKQGKDLVLFFGMKGSGITKDEFAPKLLGRKKNGDLIFGYCSLPWLNEKDIPIEELFKDSKNH